MNQDEQIAADLQALARKTHRALPSIDQTARALKEARQGRGGFLMSTLGRPALASAVGIAALVFALLMPVPYVRTTGFDLDIVADGHRTVVHLKTRSLERAERSARALMARGAQVRIEARRERVWGSVYAMAKDKILHISVDMSGKSDAEVEAEIRAQMTQAGWSPTEVEVQRSGDEATVQLGGDDGAGRRIKIVRKSMGEPSQQLDVEAGDIDDTREPGMTDQQLRDKIVRQWKARGFDADVTVAGEHIEVRVHREQQ